MRLDGDVCDWTAMYVTQLPACLLINPTSGMNGDMIFGRMELHFIKRDAGQRQKNYNDNGC